jgi:hypothetical protein
MGNFFQFEADFVDSLRCIPMQVRFKLDTCGIKLKLPHWNRFSPEQRQKLVDLPCTTADEIQTYRQFLQQLILETTGEAATDLPVEAYPAWEDSTTIPIAIDEKATEMGVALTLDRWATLSPLQRFVLIKLSRSSHENHNFLPALKEFHLV